MARFTTMAALALCGCALLISGCQKSDTNGGGKTADARKNPDKIKIGFLVKQPEEPWFQLEWKFAQKCADEDHFDLIKIGASDGAKALAAIDNLAVAGAKGFVICTPDVKLGPAIVAKAKSDNLKLIAVDDQFIGSDGKPMKDVHYLGISARKIGEDVGTELYKEMKKRKWPVDQTGACMITFNELDTARERTEGARNSLVKAGFPADHIYAGPQKTSDVPGAFDAANILLTQHPNIKYWLVFGMNDSAVLGAVRATESRQFDADHVIGIGINGTDCINEFKKSKPTGVFGSMLLSARDHGYKTTKMMYEWIKDGKEPPLDTRTVGKFITRDNYKKLLKEEGITE